MKKEFFTKAIQNLQNIAGQFFGNDSPLLYDIPSLDSVMGVAKMSETDRIFYEAYKKYGHRTHTWQYFKEMFHGDVKNMQKTVEHWKTWEEINKEAHNRYDSNKDGFSLTVANIRQITNTPKGKPTRIYELNELSETQNELQQELFPMPVYANYLTYTPELGDLYDSYHEDLHEIAFDDTKAHHDLRKKYIYELNKLLDFDNDNGKFVLYERINAYRKIIFESPKLLYMADRFDLLTPEEKLNFAQLILDKSAEVFGTPTYKVVPMPKEKPNTLGTAKDPERIFELSTSFQSKTRPLYEFLGTLVHEDSHRIDHYNPNQGLLGAQMQTFMRDYRTYDAQNDTYRMNPTEVSAFYLGPSSGNKLASEIENHKLANKIKNIFSRR